jgi:hypothetical protein
VAVTPRTGATTKPVIKTTEKIPELRREPDAPVILPTPEPETEPTKTPEEVPAPPELEPPEPPEPDTTPVEETPEVDDTVTKEEPLKLEELELKDTNTLTMLIAGLVLGIGIIGLVLFNLFGGSEDEAIVTEPALADSVAHYADATLVDLPIGTWTFNELVNTLNATLLENTDDQTTEYQYVNQRGFPVPGSTLTSIVRTDDSDGFANTVTEFRLVQTADGNRGLLLQTDDATTALGGMLNWEDTVYADVGALLDTADLAPPSAGTFTDETFGNLDVRVLKFGETTLLVYSFINDTDVVIANNLNVLRPYAE